MKVILIVVVASIVVSVVILLWSILVILIGNKNSRKRNRDLKSLKPREDIKISHLQYDSDAVFLAKIGDSYISAIVFVDGISQGHAILRTESFIKKDEKYTGLW